MPEVLFTRKKDGGFNAAILSRGEVEVWHYASGVSFPLLLVLLVTHVFDTLNGRIVRVTDGDTIVVLDSANVQHKIRRTGIAALKRKQAFGTKSKEHLSNVVAGNT